MTRNELKWNENYRLLKEYVEIHHQLPDKKKSENRGLLNWWKYNKKCAKLHKLTPERVRLLEELNEMRTVRQISLSFSC